MDGECERAGGPTDIPAMVEQLVRVGGRVVRIAEGERREGGREGEREGEVDRWTIQKGNVKTDRRPRARTIESSCFPRALFTPYYRPCVRPMLALRQGARAKFAEERGEILTTCTTVCAV